MKANAIPLLALFEKKMRLEVPLFQRQYVWSLEHQWQPLWEDIARKFMEYLEGRKDAPPHFLGAMVLDQKQTPVTHVEKRQVIDGQQRLTTLQIFLSALRDFCREQDCDDIARELDNFTLNKGMMADSEVDRFKVWPTQLDRDQFRDVIGLGSRKAIEEKHPLVRQKYAKKPDPRPRMIEAYVFFSNQIHEFFVGTDSELPIAATQPLAARVEECFQALKNALQVVAIDLEKDDDAQVIFETLNARGEPLLPADLLRNYIFLRAARLNESQEQLYEKYWRGFDDDFWRAEARQGRLIRPRSDLFMQHFLTSRQMVDIPIKHLFVEYKFWIERARPFATITDELSTLAKQASEYRRLIDPKSGDPIFGLSTFLECFDIRTVYPLLLFLFDAGLSGNEWIQISKVLESYLLRRAVLGLSTKSYTRTFLNLAKALKRAGPSAENMRSALADLVGESVAWPTDEEFAQAWESRPAYLDLNNAKVVHILRRIGDSCFTSKNEQIAIDCPLTVEHILPQSWQANWPLPDGSLGLSTTELWSAPEGDTRAAATKTRNAVLQTMGNLTILTQELNSAVSNSAWDIKKPQLLISSLLPINQQLHEYETWSENSIEKRGRGLFERALKIWPGPSKSIF